MLMSTATCLDLGLDIQDDLGRHEVGFVENVEKTPANNGQGCHFKARFQVNKVEFPNYSNAV